MMNILQKMRSWRGCDRGQLALSFAIALPALLGVVGVAVDYVGMTRNKANLQGLADAAATAAARELALANTNKAQIEAVAQLYANQKSGGGGGSGSKPSASMMSMQSAASGSGSSGGGGSGISVSTNVNFKTGEVEVTIKQEWKPILAHFVFEGVTPVAASATAQLVSSGKICVVGLMESSLWASVHLDNSSKLKADGCGIYSNSESFASIRADSSAQATAESICAAGGYWAANGSSLTPKPTTDCPKIPDPLVDRIEPAIGPCVANDLIVASDTTLKPGTYCGGLQLTGNASVKLLPGIYVIENGPLIVADKATLSGENVGFFLSASSEPFDFHPDTTIDLSAPKDGPMAGLLFFESRSIDASKSVFSKGTRVNRVQSNNARKLIGTIYLPKSILQVDAEAPVADESAYTAIVTMRLWLKEGPTLVLNSNYAATEVPVPKALIGGQVVLTE